MSTKVEHLPRRVKLRILRLQYDHMAYAEDTPHGHSSTAIPIISW